MSQARASAASAAAHRARTRARIEDFEFLLSVGEDRGRALARVGWSEEAAYTALRKYGRRDLMYSAQ